MPWPTLVYAALTCSLLLSQARCCFGLVVLKPALKSRRILGAVGTNNQNTFDRDCMDTIVCTFHLIISNYIINQTATGHIQLNMPLRSKDFPTTTNLSRNIKWICCWVTPIYFKHHWSRWANHGWERTILHRNSCVEFKRCCKPRTLWIHWICRHWEPVRLSWVPIVCAMSVTVSTGNGAQTAQRKDLRTHLTIPHKAIVTIVVQ